MTHVIQAFCENTTSRSDTIHGCIKENTYNQTDVWKDVLLGYTMQKSLLKDDGLWTEDFTWSWYGRTYTLDITDKIGLDEKTGRLFVAFEYDLNYDIFVHDPFYFAMNDNPTTFPSTILRIRPNETKSHYYRLSLTEVEELDLPEDPCNPDQDYNFQAASRRASPGRWAAGLAGTAGVSRTALSALRWTSSGNVWGCLLFRH